MKTQRTLSEGQRAYEAKRAAKAGMSLEKWLASKEREREAERELSILADFGLERELAAQTGDRGSVVPRQG